VIGLEVDIFFLVYLGTGFLLFSALWLYYEQKDKQAYNAKRTKVVFHCIKCSEIYTGPHEAIERDCPQCGFTNGRLGF